MSELLITTAKRVFQLNDLKLPDPDPSMPLDDVLELYSNQYPELTNATMEEPEINEEGTEAIYRIKVNTGKNG